jgi:hypothetical protein
LYAGQSAKSRGGAGFNGFVSTVEVIPGERVHSRPEDDIRTALPGFRWTFLRGCHGAAHDLKYVGGRSRVPIVNADRDAHYKVSAKLSGYAHGDGFDKAAIGKAARSNFDGFKESRESTARSEGVD